MGICVNNGEQLIILLTIISWIDLVLKNIYILTFTSLNVRMLVDLLFAITSIFDLLSATRQKGHRIGVLFVLVREASSDSAPRLCLGTSGDRALASSAVRRRILLFFYLQVRIHIPVLYPFLRGIFLFYRIFQKT